MCTANVVENIPNPLLDRMEVISIAGYITDEKMHIARDYLEKATREACGIKPEQVICYLLFSAFCHSVTHVTYIFYLNTIRDNAFCNELPESRFILLIMLHPTKFLSPH